MSVRINPCFGCPIRTDCETRAVYKARVSGLGLRSATFRCDRLAERLRPGTRIVVRHPIKDTDDYEYGVSHVELPATITTSDGQKFACVIDREALAAALGYDGEYEDDMVDRVRFRKTMRHSRIVRFLDEPRRLLAECGNPITPDGKHDSRNGPCGCKQFGEVAA